uniref:hypothetical protein n=1 Tax=Streptomyces canus TaxID=58343 RepID=UPI0027D7E60C|nr:hypothetical protein [Streptomyces canus]
MQRLLTDLLMVAGLLGPPAGIAVAMLRHRLYDIEVVLGRAIVFTLLSGLVLGVYLAVVAGVGTLAPGSLGGTAAIAVAALLAAAGRGAVQSTVDRLLFGHRHDPYAVMARVGRHLAPATEPVEAMHLLVDELRRALRLPYAAFTGPAVTATSGTPVPGAGWRIVPCLALGRRVGLDELVGAVEQSDEVALAHTAALALRSFCPHPRPRRPGPVRSYQTRST